jgi:putative transposase
VKTERKVEHVPSGTQLGIDVGLRSFLTDSEGTTVDNPRHYREAEKRLKRLQRRLSRKQKKSANRKKARKALAKQHLKVQRQREDFARKQANALVSSCDLIAYENLQIRNMVRNRKLAKSIHDAGWGIFLQWVTRYAFLHDIPVIAVPPHYTSQKCSDCGTIVKKSLSIRTHICHGCSVVLDRDQNAALNILQKALSPDQNGTEGHSGTNEPVS